MSASAVRAGEAYVEVGARDRTQKALASAERRLRSFAGYANSVGSSLMKVGVAGGAAIGVATGILAGFDRQMAAVSAKTGATADELQAMRDVAKDLGASTKFSASEAAAGMGYLAQAGFDAKQILASIPQVLALAAAGGTDLAMAADIASDVGSAFGLTADEIGRVADVIALTSAKTNTSVEMMGETFQYVAPIAKAAGQSIEEVSAAAGILGNSGIKASKAGTDLKGILEKIANDTSAQKLRDLGVSLTDATGEMRPLLDIMRDYGAATESMTGPERLAKSMDIFGKIAGGSAILLSTAGDSIDTLRDQMNNAEGAAQSMAATMQEGVHGSFDNAISAAQGLAIQYGEALKPAIVGVIDAGTAALRWATDFIARHQTLAQIIAVAAIAVGLLGAALVTVGTIVATVAGVVSAVGAVIGSSFLGPVLAAIAAAAMFAVKLVKLAGMAYLVVNSSDAMRKSFWEVIGTLGEMLSVAWRTVKGVASALMSGDIGKAAAIMWAGLRATFWAGVDQAIKIFSKLPEFIFGAVKSIASFMWKVFSGVFSAIARGLTALATGSVAGIKAAVGAISEVASGEFKLEPNVRSDRARAELDKLLADYEDTPADPSPSSDAPAATPPPADPSPASPEIDELATALKMPPEDLQSLVPDLALDQAGAVAIGDLKLPPGTVSPDLEKLQTSLREVAGETDNALADDIAAKIDPAAGESLVGATENGGETAKGTTSAAAAMLAAFQGDVAAERSAKAAERQVDILENIDRNIADGGVGGGITIV
ncbi:phage tail tape measure protein [Roseiconus lacunae]|uniref:phage tail tape measure protein n=1 Tax=Roseiconus lacunae TaxID=2605694 RepID=UPI003086F9B3|nr:phage tail tape measure protein [Stieleria sp. HD01]